MDPVTEEALFRAKHLLDRIEWLLSLSRVLLVFSVAALFLSAYRWFTVGLDWKVIAGFVLQWSASLSADRFRRITDRLLSEVEAIWKENGA